MHSTSRVDELVLNKIVSAAPAAKCIGNAMTELSARSPCGEMVISVRFAGNVVNHRDITRGITCGTSAGRAPSFYNPLHYMATMPRTSTSILYTKTYRKRTLLRYQNFNTGK